MKNFKVKFHLLHIYTNYNNKNAQTILYSYQKNIQK